VRKRLFLLLAVLAVAALSFGCSNTQMVQGPAPVPTALKVHFIDVGQADSILVQLPNTQNMLVDAGNNDDDQAVISYLKKQGIKRLDYIVATHPHEDHIGGMDTVIGTFSVGKLYAPRVSTNTRTFEDFLSAVKDKGLKITPATAGLQIINQPTLQVTLLAPCGRDYDDLNQWSAVTRITYGKISFLLTGDAGNQSEQEMMASGTNLKADVLKVGHHGSRYSTSSAFLTAVSPRYAVISVGAGNDYGHPHKETLDKLAAAGVKVYRTDLNGTIVATSDGVNITFSTLKNTVQPRAPTVKAAAPAEKSKTTATGYIGNKNSKKFHRPTCSSLPAAQNRVYFETRDIAMQAGYVPCKICNP
jgi:beta-lactamase superfamily II metal-dependent hydrolase